jgi:HPt (histidine-containing phosphotransfer) domain-containing protein
MVTNLDYLMELSGGNKEFIKEVTQLFIDETPSNIRKMQDALLVKDYQTIRTVAHKIKPSMTFFGIAELEEEIKSLEYNAMHAINLDTLEEQINKATYILNLAVNELRQME